MTGHYVYKVLDEGGRHFDLGARGTHNYFKLNSEFVSVGKDPLLTMGGNSSSNQREPVKAGVRDGRIVQLTRSFTPFPSWSNGSWKGGSYQIVGAGVVMYQSRDVPGPIRSQLGSGSVSFEGNHATITFNRNDGNLVQYFQGF
ncbi:uncharacterized protein LOC112554979 [Pomacea canaliculata]|uniref:uncharacterized protein LOC112554979 n=1 Tax=Pomacea canaliculata TaxID=400727 RepID=UPI000D73A72B|nr:uncharacterized protein LOC112554979 [Pomacea canaliculata]